MSNIDFVILWVDGSDKEWLKEKNKFSPNKIDINNSSNRFRDWDNLQYIFRGIEKFAPWVNKVHFVTYGHLPDWLNLDNPKLNIVKHKDFIPDKYLPTFSSHPIELNLHRINGLADQFVYFNDDTFLCKEVKETDFFINGNPCDQYIETPLISSGKNDSINHIHLNNMDILNKNFNKYEFIKNNILKVFNIKYGFNMIRTVCLLPWNKWSNIYNSHLPNAFLKKTFIDVWDKEYDKLNSTSYNKFRNVNDINQYLMQYWQIVSGNFNVRKNNFGKYFAISNDNTKLCNAIKSQKYNLLCLNDDSVDINFEKSKNEILQAFNEILPDACSFEVVK